MKKAISSQFSASPFSPSWAVLAYSSSLVRNRTKLYSRFSCISSSTRCLALPCLAQCVCSFGVGARPTTGSKPLMNGAKR